MSTNFNKLLPPQPLLYQLRELEELGLVKVKMLKKLISNGKLEAVRIGNRLHISRQTLITFLEERTMKVGA